MAERGLTRKLALLLVEESGRSNIRRQEDHGCEGDEDRCDAFKDENPTPAGQSADAVHLDDSGGKKTWARVSTIRVHLSEAVPPNAPERDADA